MTPISIFITSYFVIGVIIAYNTIDKVLNSNSEQAKRCRDEMIFAPWIYILASYVVLMFFWLPATLIIYIQRFYKRFIKRDN